MHTMWKGSLSFGLVNVPVRMYAATESKDVKFRYLHKACHTPIEYQRRCPRCDRPVAWDEVVRGVEYRPNEFVVLEEEELEALRQPRSHTIDIVGFVRLAEVDPVYFDKTYYLAPDPAGAKAYRLLQAALEQTGRIAVARTVLRSAETLCCVRVFGRVLVVETLFWPDEVRPVEQLPAAGLDAPVADAELRMAVTLIEQLSGPFQPEQYADERRQRIQELVETKIQRADVAQVRPQVADNIIDLMKALEESIRRTAKASASERKSAAAPEPAPEPVPAGAAPPLAGASSEPAAAPPRRSRATRTRPRSS
ncbi:MAG: Ku protein [Alicyclobacillaceae bacterium]|nr:Ku protein [Alicyclobacillaceae bacterium]